MMAQESVVSVAVAYLKVQQKTCIQQGHAVSTFISTNTIKLELPISAVCLLSQVCLHTRESTNL